MPTEQGDCRREESGREGKEKVWEKDRVRRREGIVGSTQERLEHFAVPSPVQLSCVLHHPQENTAVLEDHLLQAVHEGSLVV